MLKEMDNYFNNLCGPAYIYYIFSIWMLIFIIVKMFIDGAFNEKTGMALLLRISISYVMIYILNWFCEKGYTDFAWFLLYWKFIFILIVLIGSFMLLDKIMSNTKININLNQN
jgi:hypothetical protein